MTDECRIRWCGEKAGHDGPHRRRLYDTTALRLTPARARPVIVQLWISGESARTIVPVLVVDAMEVGLTWQQANVMSSALHTASRRFAR